MTFAIPCNKEPRAAFGREHPNKVSKKELVNKTNQPCHTAPGSVKNPEVTWCCRVRLDSTREVGSSLQPPRRHPRLVPYRHGSGRGWLSSLTAAPTPLFLAKWPPGTDPAWTPPLPPRTDATGLSLNVRTGRASGSSAW